ncbi:hypothetical protein J4226_03070 [Candidatus Pacearchaeota archaeon]|nr:hypothetical protein [Candidatus Pacearchaeota archaeon]
MAGRKIKKQEVKSRIADIVDAEIVEDEITVPKKIKDNENKMLIWFFVVIGIVFACVLVPYFWIEASKNFEFGGASWVVEDYDDLRIFHGRFVSLTNPNLHFNVFFREDPRKNDANVEGKLDSFKYGGIISLSPEVDACRGELSRVMLDLSSFLNKGVGVGPIESGSTDEEIAKGTSRRFATCENVMDRTVVVVEIGERGIVQDKMNPNCYIIGAKDCEDSDVVERFMMKTVIDFRDSYPVEEIIE